MPGTMTAPNESELFSAITAFEKILEAVPTDRLAIETLSDAYEKMGDISKASQYLIRLADVVINENDLQAVAPLIERMRSYNREDVNKARNRLQALLEKERSAPAPAPAQAPTAAVRRAADLSHEVALAWDLLQAGRFTQADYSMVVQDLSENSMKRIDVPVSVLHALSDRQYVGLDKVMAQLCRMGGTPIIPLSSFELNREAFTLLPADFMVRRGAIVFDLIGPDAQVAILNPMDKDLREDVKRVLKRTCHFYLVSAADYDAALANIRKILGGETK